MAATPAWPPASLPRLFVDAPLRVGETRALDAGASNYLANVLRLGVGAEVGLFDDRGGDFAARIEDVAKRAVTVAITANPRPREAVPDLQLLVAPVKRGRIDLVMEKACELGVDRIQPVLTRRTVVDRLNLDRLRAHLVEAAEQCGRNALPSLHEPTKLPTVLAALNPDRTLFFAEETGGEPAAAAMAARPGSAAILIGPEGGFDPAERDAIRALPHAVGIGLGPRILRAETAAIAAVTLWMAAAGDWGQKPAGAGQ